MVKKAIERKRDCDGAYYLLCRALFAAGRYQEVAGRRGSRYRSQRRRLQRLRAHPERSRRDGKEEARREMSQRFIVALENHLKQVPEDARARVLLGANYARLGREEDALRELNLAVTLRANEASILYNAACVYCDMKKKPEALDALGKAWEAGSTTPSGRAATRPCPPSW